MENEHGIKIILASKSPRRKELLGLIVSDFEVIVSDAEELLKKGLTPEEQAVQISYEKAKAVYEKTSGDRIIIGSDSMVVKDNKIYGKPKSREHAKQMIKELLLGDKTHKIITGLSIIIETQGKCEEYKTYDEVKVYLKDMQDEEIEKWLNAGNAMDKAGAYGIQNEFCVFVEKIEGNYTTAVGLPTHMVYDVIKGYVE